MIRAQNSSMQEKVLSVSVCGTINNTELNNTVEFIVTNGGNKGADQLLGYCAADLCLCFPHVYKSMFFS